MHTQKAEFGATSMPMHSSKPIPLPEAIFKLPARLFRLWTTSVNKSIEWIRVHNKPKSKKPFSNNQTLEMSLEWREEIVSHQSQRGRL